MLLSYYGFSKEPFGATPDPRCLYSTPTHREALASLKYGFSSGRGFTALIAPPGMGKTTLLFRFLEDILESARTVFLFDIDSQCEPRELVGYILHDIGITPAGNRAEMHSQLKSVLVAEARAGRKFVVVIDEAQNLSEAALETVRLLSNFETPRAKLIQIVLSGQPQLSAKLMQPSLVQLRQRISTLCRLEPLSTQETFAYVDHRLKAAGYLGDQLFTKGALDLIAEASQGVPRTINSLCFNALSLCCALRRKQVDDLMVKEVIRDQQLVPESGHSLAIRSEAPADETYDAQRRRPEGKMWLCAPAITVLVLVSALCALRLAKLRAVRSNNHAGALFSDMKIMHLHEPLSLPGEAHPMKGVAAGPTVGLKLLEAMIESPRARRNVGTQYPGLPYIQSPRRGQTLHPVLKDAGSIEAGQSEWLPGPATLLGENGFSLDNVRNLP